MKILQVTNVLSPVHGGSAEVPYRLSKQLVRRGHDVTIYTSDSQLSREYIESDTELTIRAFKTWVSSANLFISPGIMKKAREETKYFDVIHMHGYRTFQNISVKHYARKHDVPYILQAHGSLPKLISKKGLKLIYDRLWGYKLLRSASKVIAVTPIEAEQYKDMGLGEDMIEIVPHGIDLSLFNNLPDSGKFREKWGLRDDPILLYLGRIHKIKGLDLLIEAYASVLEELDAVKLVIAGPDDGYLTALRRLVEELKIGNKVIFTGMIYGQEKLEAYVDADIYVLPSVYEIFGITVLEAAACGTPVIVTDRCGLADVINGQAGIAVPYHKEQLRDAILHLLKNDALRREYGGKGKSLVCERFDWRKIAEQVEVVYTKIS